MARPITFIANKAQEEFINGLVQSGQYKTEDEAINAALKQMEGSVSAKLQRLRQLIDEGDASGDYENWNLEHFLKRARTNTGG